MSRPAGGVQVLHKTIDILDALRGAPDGLGLAALSELTKLPKPTAYRIVATLESRGYLEREPGPVYRMSRKVLAEPPREGTLEQRLIRAARPAMEQLMAACKETLNLGVLDGGEVLVLETLESPQSVRMASKVGNRRFPHSTALGKVLLAGRSAPEVSRLLKAKGMPRFTATTIVQETAFLRELRRVEADGFALDNAENEPDGRCIAAPVRDREGRILAGLSISGPLPRMTVTRAKSFVPHLLAAADSIKSAL